MSMTLRRRVGLWLLGVPVPERWDVTPPAEEAQETVQALPQGTLCELRCSPPEHVMGCAQREYKESAFERLIRAQAEADLLLERFEK